MLTNFFRKQEAHRTALVLIIIFSALSLLASFVLSYEEIHLLKDPNARLSCNINSVFNCGTVMKTEKATILGDIPNSFFGIIGYAASLTLGVVMVSGVMLPRWMKFCMFGAFTGGWLFATWLFYDSLYGIGVLCPWCLTVTFSSVILLAAITHIVLRDGTLRFKGIWQQRINRWLDQDFDILIAAMIIVLFAALIILRFGSDIFS